MNINPFPERMVRLTAFDPNGRQVLNELLSFRDYCEEAHPALDDELFRKSRQIARLCGAIFDDATNIWQEFEVHFDAAGRVVRDFERTSERLPVDQVRPEPESQIAG